MNLMYIHWNPNPVMLELGGFELRWYSFFGVVGLLIAVYTAGCIRIANLMNSEIIGRPAEVSWAFVFERVDQLPRHPAQLYEALAYFGFALILFAAYRKYGWSKRHGFYFGLCISLIFTFRFFIEFIKENQETFEDSMMLNMGQLLSIPFIVAGIFFVQRAYKQS